MRSILLICTFMSAWTIASFILADEPVATKGDRKPAAKPAEKSPSSAASVKSAGTRSAADEALIRQAAETYVKAYNDGSAKGVAALFTAEAEYVDASGGVTQGRESIEKALAAHFAESTGEKLAVRIETIRFIGPGLAVEDGSARVSRSDDPEVEDSFYTAVHVKADGKWLMASVRDHADRKDLSRGEQFKQLEWMVGDWVSEGNDSLIDFSCHPVDGGNYLLREFTVRIAGRPAMAGSQRIGWDRISRHFRVWTFDSQGGFLDGILLGGGDRWVLRSTGQSAGGDVVSAKGVFTSVNGHTMTWQNVEYVVNGEKSAPADPVRIVRKAPRIQVNTK